MRDWLDAAVALLLAPLCAACGQPLRRPTRGCVCDACWDGVVAFQGPHCGRCGEPIVSAATGVAGCPQCRMVPSSVTRVRAVGPYTGSLRAILHALKYDGRRSLAAPLAARMRLAGAEVLRDADALIPVPLHRRRRRERGFNQAADLAHHLDGRVVDALARVRPTRSQTTLDADERRANMARAFRLTPQARHLGGAVVVIVDDVRTTGATLDACATTLRAAGVGDVLALTAARVESSRPR